MVAGPMAEDTHLAELRTFVPDASNIHKPSDGGLRGSTWQFGGAKIRGMKLRAPLPTLQGASFKDVVFNVLGDGEELALKDCHLVNVQIVGGHRRMVGKGRPGRVALERCSGDGLTIQGSWTRAVVLSRCDALERLQISAKCETLSASHCVLREASITGFVETWVSDQTTFEQGVWFPTVSQEARMRRTRFRWTKVNLGTIMSRCEDRSSLDIHDAVLIDWWSRLRDTYTGPRLFLVLLLTLCFVAPYAVKAGYFALMARAQPPGADPPPLQPLWEALFIGRRTGWGAVGYFALACVLVGYNAIRLLLTLRLSRLREREEHLLAAGFTQGRPKDRDLAWPWQLHRLLWWLAWLAWASAVWRTLELLTLDVVAL